VLFRSGWHSSTASELLCTSRAYTGKVSMIVQSAMVAPSDQPADGRQPAPTTHFTCGSSSLFALPVLCPFFRHCFCFNNFLVNHIASFNDFHGPFRASL
jgi:hypothetical protein